MKVVVMQARVRLWMSHSLEPLFSYDNSGQQKHANHANMYMAPYEHVPLAAYMPDGHKVIEHTFNRLKSALWNSIYEEGAILTGEELQDRVERLFKAMPIAHFTKDAESLPVTYQHIATDKGVLFTGADGLQHEGTGGDWAPDAYR